MTIILINALFFAVLMVGFTVIWRRSVFFRDDSSSLEEEGGDYTLISVSVPKNNDRTPQAAEQMFAALHGIFREGQKSQPLLSFEIVAKAKTIVFYLYIPTDLKDFVISQIYSQYPHVEIKERASDEDYVIANEGAATASALLALKNPSPYPIRTFQNFEVDPLAGITGVLSSLSDQEQAWIQFVIRPVSDDWQKEGAATIKEIKDPKKVAAWSELFWKEIKEIVLTVGRNLIGGAGEKKEEKKKEEKEKEMSGWQKQAISGIEEKVTKLGFKTNIRLLVSAMDGNYAKAKLEQLAGAFKQYNALHLNSFLIKTITEGEEGIEQYKKRQLNEGTAMLFSTTELASLYHFPSQTVATPTISWAGSKTGEAPANLPTIGSVAADELTVFAQTNFRNELKKFGIKKPDRRLHMYVIGKTGTGKSTMMENMIVDDILEGRGVAVVDPHGELIKHVMEYVPEERIQDVVYFNPADTEHPIGFNLLENVDPNYKNIVASGVVGVFEKIFGSVSWGPRLEYILRNVVLALLEYPGSTLLGVMRILTDTSYRHLVLNSVNDPVVRDFFVNEFEKYDPKFRTEAIAPIQNKVGQFLSTSFIRNIIGQPHSSIDINDIMNSGKILLVDLSVGRIGEDNSALLGSMIITKIQLAAMNRVLIDEEQRRDFYLYVDEFQNFATESFATILSEARKYRLNLTMANQYTAQMPEQVSDAVFGNVGTIVSFRVGSSDAATLCKEFEPVFDQNDLVNLDNYHIYLKMAINGVTAQAFSAQTLPRRENPSNLATEIVEESRKNFTRARVDVEDYISEWSGPVELAALQQNQQGRKNKTEGGGEVQKKESSMKQAETVDLGGRGSVEGKKPAMSMGAGESLEILKDRFDRPWYGVKKSLVEEPIAKESAEPAANNGGAGDRVTGEPGQHPQPSQPINEPNQQETAEPLITWEQSQQLGMPQIPQEMITPAREKEEDLIPVNELDEQG